MVGSSYFAIFLTVVKLHSVDMGEFLDFFKFSQQSIPAMHSMVVDWSLLALDSSFSAQSTFYPKADREVYLADLKM